MMIIIIIIIIIIIMMMMMMMIILIIMIIIYVVQFDTTGIFIVHTNAVYAIMYRHTNMVLIFGLEFPHLVLTIELL